MSASPGPPCETPPPALTWLHLLPSDSKLQCTGAPDWLRELCGTFTPAGGRAVQLCYGDAGEKLFADSRDSNGSSGHAPFTPEDAGIVAINSRGLSDKALASAGFTYIRRFAAIPSLREARWLIPLDAPAISSAAFSLYTPARASAKLKRWAVKLATFTRLPVWYRDHVCIALRQMPPLERALARLFPGDNVRIALSSGAPPGARNRKASALVIGSGGRLLAFAKLARSPIARRILANEAAALPRLARLPVPRLLLDEEIDGTRVLAQTPLPGRPAPVAWGEAHEAFLQSLRTSEQAQAASVGMVAGLKDRLREATRHGEELIPILDSLRPALESFSVPVTIVHGDFAPWNLRIHAGRIAAFDWEYAELSGLPLIDEIHYRLQVGMMLEDWNVFRAEQCLAQLADARPMGLEPAQVRAIAAVYLLDALARLLGEGYGQDHDMIGWHRQLLLQVASNSASPLGRVAAA